MNLLHPYLLGGLALVAVPVVVHLVTREKPRHLLFPAFRFLRQNYQTNRRKLRLHQLVLLALRMLLIAALCGALAQPLFKSQLPTFLSETQPVTVVLLFDTSPSMDYERGGLTRLQDAKRRADELVEALPSGSQVAVLDSDQRVGQFLDRPEPIREEVRSLEVRPAGGPVSRKLDQAFNLLADKSRVDLGEPPPRYLYIFSDRTRASWDAAEVQGRAPPEGVVVVYVDVGVEKPVDLAIEQVTVEPPAVSPGHPVRINAQVRATGGKANRKITCQLNDAQTQEVVVDLADGVPRAVSFEYRTAPVGAADTDAGLRPGSHQVVVRLEGTDQLAFNNTGFATFVVRPGRKVLTLMDRPSEREPWAVAMDALGFASSVVPIRGAERLDLKPYDLVCLYQPAAPEAALWKKLYDYVDGGGALVVVPGDRGNFDDKNASQLLPGALQRLATAPTTRGVGWDWDPANRSALMMPFFKLRRERGNVEFFKPEGEPRARRYWQIKPADAARVVSRFADEDRSPALLERQVGGGRVVLFATRLDVREEPLFEKQSPRAWTTYWENSFGLVLVDRVCRDLVGDSVSLDLNLVCGQSVLLQLPPQPGARTYTLHGPGQPARGLPLGAPAAEGDRVTQLPISQAVLPGNYSVRDAKGTTLERFSMNVRAAESKLVPPVAKEEIEKTLGADTILGVDHELSLREAIARKPQPIPLLPLLMLLLLLLLLAENLFGNRRRDVPATRPGTPVGAGVAARTVLMWTALGLAAGGAMGAVQNGGYGGVLKGMTVAGLLGLSHAVVALARFGSRDGAILGGLLGSMVGVLYGWLTLSSLAWLDGPLAVVLGFVLGAAVGGADGWFLGARETPASPERV